MEIPINCKICGEIIFMDSEMEGLEEEFNLNICEECEDDGN